MHYDYDYDPDDLDATDPVDFEFCGPDDVEPDWSDGLDDLSYH